MSAASSFNYSLLLTARDQTGGAVDSAGRRVLALGRLAARPITIGLRVAQGGLAALRDINVGLRPLVAGLDNLIERGTALEVVRNSFASLTRTGGARMEALARQVVAASSGTLRLAEAMQVANRALGSGLGFNQLLTAIEFIGKKAITTGKDARSAIDTVITGLSRGSTLFLDDFGILVDGVDGVKRSFDAIKGAGAFDSLGPAAQKAETVRQAIAEMQQQMGRIGVSGRELTFVYSQIKNLIGDATDKLVLSLAKSTAMQSALRGTRDVIAGISTHFDQGGTFGQLLFGKGDKGGGILSVAGAAIRDAFGSLVTIAANAGAILGETLMAGWETLKTDGLAWAKSAGGAFVDGIIGRKKDIQEAMGGWLFRLLGGNPDNPAANNPTPGQRALADPAGAAAGMLGYVNTLVRGVIGNAARGFVGMTGGPLGPAGATNPDVHPILFRGPAGALRAQADAVRRDVRRQTFIARLLDGTGFDRTREQARRFGEQFGVDVDGQGAQGDRDRAVRQAAGLRGLRLTGAAARQLRDRQQILRREIDLIEGGGFGARQAAVRETGREADELRRAGFRVTPGVRRRLFQENLRDAIEERRRPRREEIRRLEDIRRGAGRGAALDEAAGRLRNQERTPGIEKYLQRVDTMVGEMTAAVNALIARLGGAEQKIAAARG